MEVEKKINGGVVVGVLSDYVEAGEKSPADTAEKPKRQRKPKEDNKED